MAVKASGAYKHCKPCSGGSNNNKNHNYANSDTGPVPESLHCAYRRAGSSNSTRMLRGKEMGLAIKGGCLSDGGTPASVSGRSDSVVFMEDDEPEWVAQVEPGVLITFVSLPQGGNDLKRIRFRYFQDGNITGIVYPMIFIIRFLKVLICLRVITSLQ